MTSLTLALDAMGGDHGPHVTVPAALQALKLYPDLRFILVGDQDQIQPYLAQSGQDITDRIELRHTT